MTLFDLAEELIALREAYENDEPITPEMLDVAEMDVKEKIRNYCIIIKEIKAERQAVQHMKHGLIARERSLTNNLEFLLQTLHNVQDKLGIKKVNVDGHRASLCKKPAGVNIVDENAVADAFRKVTIEFRKAEAIRHFKDTGELPDGFELKDTETYVRVS